jgi:hypothetical protein
MNIPQAIFETKAEVGQAMLDEEDRERRRLLAKAKASIDWLTDHLDAVQKAYQLLRSEREYL